MKLVAGRRKRPQKALTRKDFRYKRDWKYHKENEQEREFEEDDSLEYEWWWMLLAGFAIIFFKFIVPGVLDVTALDGESAGENVSKMLTYALGFFAVAGINILGHSIAKAEGIKTRFAGVVITILSFAGFLILVGVLILPNGGN